MIAVSDTGPIIGLAKASHLSLLKDLFGKVLIPPNYRIGRSFTIGKRKRTDKKCCGCY